MFACLLPDDYTRLRQAGLVYLVSIVIYGLTHNLRWWILGQVSNPPRTDPTRSGRTAHR